MQQQTFRQLGYIIRIENYIAAYDQKRQGNVAAEIRHWEGHKKLIGNIYWTS